MSVPVPVTSRRTPVHFDGQRLLLRHSDVWREQEMKKEEPTGTPVTTPSFTTNRLTRPVPKGTYPTFTQRPMTFVTMWSSSTVCHSSYCPDLIYTLVGTLTLRRTGAYPSLPVRVSPFYPHTQYNYPNNPLYIATLLVWHIYIFFGKRSYQVHNKKMLNYIGLQKRMLDFYHSKEIPRYRTNRKKYIYIKI